MDTHFYEFGEFRIEPARRKFYEAGTVIPLTPKVFDLLVVLLQNHGRVLEKRFLLDQVWSDVVVEEHSLTQAISVLRKILGDKPNNHNHIKTIPGRGYQFIAPVKEVIEEDELVRRVESVADVAESQSLWSKKRSLIPVFFVRTLARRPYFAATFLLIGIFAGTLPPWLSSKASRISSPDGVRLTSIAVKPFQSTDKESCKTGLSETLTDAVLTRLTQQDALTVRALEHSCSIDKTSASPVKAAPRSGLESVRALGVQAVIEGQVQKSAENFRVSVRLIRTSDGVALWADQVEIGHPNDTAIQDRLSALVAEAVLTRTG